MNPPVLWELQLISCHPDLINDREGADALVVELLLGSWKVEVGRVQPDLIADLVVAGVRFLLVVLTLHVGPQPFEARLGFLDEYRSSSS